ncbi:ATP synthase subunit I [Sporosarcina jiandibaonis]|uniref:ATP synthase subunit I n=1 Tax=Sporosarcina jiandibaonis TaxID=2715535 RepID=UPI001552B528|nr:ATP synthase subunit I [Sporosarcina jiandibaonis]
MQTLQEIHNRQRRALFFLLAFFVLGWAFTEWQTVFAGLILGSLFGLYNFWILVRRFEQFERAVTEGKKRISLGTAMRFASGIAVAAIATAMPEQFDLISAVIGFGIPYLLLLGERIIYHVRHY